MAATKMQFRGIVQEIEVDGYTQLEVDIQQKTTYQRLLKQMPLGQKLIVILSPEKRQRTLQQNAYWWGACYPELAELTGYTINEVHELCKQMFIKPEVIEVKAEIYNKLKDIIEEVPKKITHRRSTTDLSTSEGVEYTDCVRRLANELGGHIPTPQEAGYLPN